MQIGLKQGLREGWQDGLEKGIQKGIQQGMQTGKQIGLAAGELIGKIQLAQHVLKHTVSDIDKLEQKSEKELQAMWRELERDLAALS